MRIAMLFLLLNLTDGVLEHRGDVEADVDQLAVGLSPQHEIVAALAVGGLAERLAHQRAAAELREKIGPVYQPYPFANRALVKALYNSLRGGLISRADFACCMANMRGEFR